MKFFIFFMNFLFSIQVLMGTTKIVNACKSSVPDKEEEKYVLFVNSSDRLDIQTFDRSREYLFDIFRIPIKVVTMKLKFQNWSTFRQLISDKKIAVAVIVIDNNNFPPLLINPEERLAIINTLAYSPVGTNKELLTVRINKELARAYCGVLGSSIAPVFSTKDLDSLKGGVSPMALNSIFRYAKALHLNRIKPILKTKNCSRNLIKSK